MSDGLALFREWLWTAKAIRVDEDITIQRLRKEISALVRRARVSAMPVGSLSADPPRVYGHPRALSAVCSLYDVRSVDALEEGGFALEGTRWIVRWDLADDVLVIVVPSGDPVGFMLGVEVAP